MHSLRAAALLFCVVTYASAQEQTPMPDEAQLNTIIGQQRDRAHKAIDEVGNQPERRRAPRVDMQRSIELGSVDPLEIAKRYRAEHDLLTKEVLYIFVSTSMPNETIKRLADQARLTSGTLVFRGIKGGIKGYTAMVGEIQPILQTGVALEIHPELFNRFQIEAVPAFVLTKNDEGCAGSQCDGESIGVAGDVSLAFALDHLAKETHPLAKVAARLRQKLP